MTTDTVTKQAVVEGDGWSHRRHGQGRRHARPAAGHDARRAHHRRRSSTPPTCDRALRAATAGHLRPARLRRLHVHQRHRHADGQRRQRRHARRAEDFTEALTQACDDLALQLLADAEGADHEIAIKVLGAASEDDAVEVGRSVARSNLFKSAVFGNDPNWGRVLASIGTTQRGVRPGRPRRRDERRLGLPAARRPPRTRATRRPRPAARSPSPSTSRPAPTRATVWTNDLTHAYVHENCAYST